MATISHELAHATRQTGGAAISTMPQEGANLRIDPDPQLEREADEAAEQALSGEEPLVVNRMGTDVHVQRTSKAVTASNAKNIQELTEEVRDLRETVGRHDETIKEIETAREEFEESLEQNLNGEALAEIEAAAEQSAGAEFAKGGGKGLLKRLAAGGAGVATMIGLGASDPSALADVLPVVASSVVGAATDGADAALSQGGGATPEVVAETVETKLAQSEDFAEKIATNDALAEALAGKDAFVDSVADLVAGKTGGETVAGEGGHV